MAAVGADGAGGVDVALARLEDTLLGLFACRGHYGCRRHRYDRDYGRRLDSSSFLEREALQGFFHLEPTLFDVLRFFQLTVF